MRSLVATLPVRALAVVFAGALAAASHARDDTPRQPAAAAVEEAPEGAYPLEYWALRPVTRNVRVSPDGKRLALMRIASRDGDPTIEIYDAADLKKEPFRINADPMEIYQFWWVSDKQIVFVARQKVRKIIDDFNQGVYRWRFAILDVEKKKVSNFGIPGRLGIASFLPEQPDKIIVGIVSGGGGGPGARNSIFRPPAYYELDLAKGTKKLLIRGKISLSQYEFDSEGNPWLALGFDERKKEYVWYHRQAGAKDWNEIRRLHEDSFEDFGIGGFDVDRRDQLFVTAHAGHDTTGLYSLNVTTGKMTLIDRRDDVDLGRLLFSSREWTDPDRVVGYSYFTDRVHRKYINEEAAATHAQLAGIIPDAHNVSITSRSRDGATLTVTNSGPRDPGTHYLLKDGRFSPVGSVQPLLESEKLADVEYVTYKSRDGKDIRGYLTVPHGKPPFPLIVLPHGGPFVREVVSYDKWGQLFANNGYMVLQPQYRGSRNYGLGFYTSAFLGSEGGQGGGKMQDDKDDGALFLVGQGRADPDRIAMFGWSYGGYAAAVAASRTPQLYQCVVAGASVFDNLQQVNYYRDRLSGAQEVEQLRMWDNSVSPIKEVAKVNVPMLIVHGDVDQRVPVEHAKKYIKALQEHDKPHKYIELEGADHFSDTWSFDHELEFYTATLDFLANDCGFEKSSI